MARLGKRERHAKRALIKANQAAIADGTFERSSGALKSRLDTSHLLAKSHTMGARVPQNMKGTEGKRSVAGRWSEQPRKVDMITGPARTIGAVDTRRAHERRKALAKAQREG